MGRFCPLYVRRSDGLLQTTTKHGGRLQKEANKPTEKQLNSDPDKDGIRDYYREVAIDETKHLDWRRKLGAMLARELDLDQSKAYILASFPENYQLYEHVKTAKKGEGEATKSKTHAGGGNDRQDAYLYGHPLGRKKRYRSPGDYFHHLLWLATDEAGDSDNCGCKICNPDELDASLREKEKEQQKLDAIPNEGAARRPSAQARPAHAPAPPASLQAHVAPQPASRPTPSATPQPALQTPAKPLDANIDTRYGLFLFRQGEMVWYDRRGAWGLGVIVERWKVQAQSHYRIQPLSWPGHENDSVVVPKDLDMRPWLAWSVPPLTHEALRQASTPLNYDTFDFNGLQAGKYGPGNIEIDASILAAKAIDASYTTFAPESRTEPQPGVIEVRWGGLYFGAEKVWLEDPVRLNNPQGQNGTRVLVVRQILERNQKSAFNTQTWSTLNIIGDVYILQPTRYNNAQNPIVPGTDYPGLPSRMLEDLRRRNTYTIPAMGLANVWKPQETSASFELKDIKGRWYESSLLLPILLQGQLSEYETRARQGDIPEVVSMMNGRCDCNKKDDQLQLADVRKQKREQAFSKAVPARTVIVDGVNTPAQQPQQLPPQPQQSRVGAGLQGHGAASNAQTTPQTQEQHATGMSSNPGAGFEEFMDLDGLGGADMMGGFDQSYL